MSKKELILFPNSEELISLEAFRESLNEAIGKPKTSEGLAWEDTDYRETLSMVRQRLTEFQSVTLMMGKRSEPHVSNGEKRTTNVFTASAIHPPKETKKIVKALRRREKTLRPAS